jgi:SulP family sulfate permease
MSDTEKVVSPVPDPPSPRSRRFRILPGLTTRRLGTEILAGVTLLAIAVPLNIGYAQIAGLPPTAGLYAMIVPSILFALLASTRQIVAAPDAAASALVASSITGLAVAGSADYLMMAGAQAIVSGGVFAACAVFRLGFLASFLSKPILVGFVGGLALDVLVSQVAKMLGVKIESGAEFPEKLAQLVAGIPGLNWWAVAISVLSLAILLGGRRLAARVPWALVVLVVTTVVVAVTGLADRGVAVLGPVESGGPTFAWPALGLGEWLALLPSAAALALVTMAEGLLVARSYGELRGYATNPNRDLLAFGAANVGSGLTGSFAVGSSTSRTAAMDQAGSRTQLPALVAALGTLLLLLFGTTLLEDIPSPAIGAVVALAVLPLLGIREFLHLWRTRKFEFFIALICFLGAILLGPILGIAIAFVLSLLNIARRASTPPVDLLVERSGEIGPANAATSVSAPGVAVVRFAAPLFFANAARFEDTMRHAALALLTEDARNLVIDCEAITDVDVTGAASLTSVRKWASDRGIAVAYSRLTEHLKDQLDDFGLTDKVEVYPTNRAAIQALRSDRSPATPPA